MGDPVGAPPPAIFRFFERTPRQGPGDAALTRRLLDHVRRRIATRGALSAADMGCGSGAAGLVLAEAGADVMGVDIHQPYLDAFAAAAAARGLEGRVRTRRASMLDSGLPPGGLDLIWSEGAVFAVGVDAALRAFHALLRPGGVVVFSDAMWLVADPPAPLRAFWAREYPAMRDVAGGLGAAAAAGYRFILAETLPEAVWETSFFGPIEAALAALGPDDAEERAVGEGELAFRDLMRAHPGSCGYVFLALQRVD